MLKTLRPPRHIEALVTFINNDAHQILWKHQQFRSGMASGAATVGRNSLVTLTPDNPRESDVSLVSA